MRGELMEKEIREQPAILAQGASRFFGELPDRLSTESFDMVLLAARGSSDNAALFGRYLIEIYLGIPVVLAAPSVLTRYGRRIKYPKALAIGVSQSGAAPDVAEVLAAMREDGHATLAITNTAGSRVTQAAEHHLLLETGKEQSVAATKTYSATLLALYETVRKMGGSLADPSSLLPTDAWVNEAKVQAEEVSGAIVRCNPLFSLGRGFGFSTSQEAALKLMECALISCEAFSRADFEHGPKALAGHGSAAITFDGPMPELAAQGCEILESPIPPIPGDPNDPIRPIWDVIFAQWLALTAARARGLNPDRPRHIQKVTETL